MENKQQNLSVTEFSKGIAELAIQSGWQITNCVKNTFSFVVDEKDPTRVIDINNISKENEKGIKVFTLDSNLWENEIVRGCLVKRAFSPLMSNLSMFGKNGKKFLNQAYTSAIEGHFDQAKAYLNVACASNKQFGQKVDANQKCLNGQVLETIEKSCEKLEKNSKPNPDKHTVGLGGCNPTF